MLLATCYFVLRWCEQRPTIYSEYGDYDDDGFLCNIRAYCKNRAQTCTIRDVNILTPKIDEMVDDDDCNRENED